MRKFAVLAVVLLVILVAMVTSPQTKALSADAPTITRTPAATATFGKILFPIIVLPPTFTPSPTPTPTNTPPPTPTHSSYNVTTGHLSGNIFWKEDRPVQRYYMNIEWIKYIHWIFNTSGGSIERYQILGVHVTWPDGVRNQFHSSWTGAPDYVSGNCFGPSGITLDWSLPLRCGSDQGSGQAEDHVGASSDISVDTPGTYTLQYFACQSSSVSQCQSGGEWHKLGNDLLFEAVPPPPPVRYLAPAPTGTDVCRLIMSDDSHGRLECVKRAKSRPGPPR